MKILINYLGCGRYVAAGLDYKYGEFIVSNLPEIVEKIIPFFKKYPIIGNKSLDFYDFCKISSMKVAKCHTTNEGLEKIRKINEGMNLRRKYLSDKS
jgi:LAGLIDADG endonuclease